MHTILKAIHAGVGFGSGTETTLRVESECLLDKGTEWVVGCSTEMVDS